MGGKSANVKKYTDPRHGRTIDRLSRLIQNGAARLQPENSVGGPQSSAPTLSIERFKTVRCGGGSIAFVPN